MRTTHRIATSSIAPDRLESIDSGAQGTESATDDVPSASVERELALSVVPGAITISDVDVLPSGRLPQRDAAGRRIDNCDVIRSPRAGPDFRLRRAVPHFATVTHWKVVRI